VAYLHIKITLFSGSHKYKYRECCEVQFRMSAGVSITRFWPFCWFFTSEKHSNHWVGVRAYPFYELFVKYQVSLYLKCFFLCCAPEKMFYFVPLKKCFSLMCHCLSFSFPLCHFRVETYRKNNLHQRYVPWMFLKLHHKI
jgi:hypothetical protein